MSFSGETASELTFSAGTVITVLSQKGEWWKGELPDGKKGYFPPSFVEINAAAPVPVPTPVASAPVVKRGSVAERAAMFGGGSKPAAVPEKPSLPRGNVAARASAFQQHARAPAVQSSAHNVARAPVSQPPPQPSRTAAPPPQPTKSAAPKATAAQPPSQPIRVAAAAPTSAQPIKVAAAPAQPPTQPARVVSAQAQPPAQPTRAAAAPPAQPTRASAAPPQPTRVSAATAQPPVQPARIQTPFAVPKPPPPPPPRPPTVRYVKALFDYEPNPNRIEEMGLRRGTTYRVLTEIGQWLVGIDEITGAQGEFPGNYVENCAAPPPAPSSRQQQARASPQPQRRQQAIPFEFGATESATVREGAFQLGKYQIYRYGAFLGALGGSPRRVDVPGGDGPGAPVTAVRISAEVVRVALSRVLKSALTQKLVTMLEGFTQTCERVAQAVGSSDPAALHSLACFAVDKVSKAAPGELLLLPGGWLPWKPESKTVSGQNSSLDDTLRPNPEAMVKKPPFRYEARVVLYLLRRRTDEYKKFDFCVVNANVDAGSINLDDYGVAKYHGIEPCEKTATFRHKLVLELEDVPQEKLMDGGIWFMLFRLLTHPHATHDASLLYERLLPNLNAVRPIGANPSKRSELRSASPKIDASHAACVMEAVSHAAVLVDAPRAIADGFVTQIRLQLLKMADADVTKSTSLSSRDAETLDVACRAFARDCSRIAQIRDTPVGAEMLEDALKTVESVDSRRLTLTEEALGDLNHAGTIAKKLSSTKSVSAPGGACFPLFGRFRRDASIDGLVGGAIVPPIELPVELSKVPDNIVDYNSATMALRTALHQCTLLANQAHLIRHTYLLRCALLQHVVTRVLPLPLPLDRPDGASTCFWRAFPMRYETQVDLLRLLQMITRHFACAALSLRLTRSFDAARILTMGCVAVIADAVLRRSACDSPSWLSRHYSGDADGPTFPFGFDMGLYDVESQYSAFTEPHLCAARTAVLDYFSAMARIVGAGDERTLFAFERAATIGSGEKSLLAQLCLQTGFPVLEQPEVYLTGEMPELLDCYPELAFFRDVVFTFKALQAPTSDALPSVRAWRPADAALHWASKSNPPKPRSKRDADYRIPPRQLVIRGFGKVLAIQYDDDLGIKSEGGPKIGLAEEKRVGSRSKWRHFLDFVGLGRLPRAPPSKGDPSVLVGQKVYTEEDVLFVRHLPDFDGMLNARDCELLVTYLTAPYLRIPLLLRFFADHARLRALTSQDLRDVFDACLFEPSLFRPPEQGPLLGWVPTMDRRELATPCGLLFNELRCAPSGVVAALDDMLDAALELDTGRYSPTVAPVLLYVIRTIVRIEGFCLFLLRKHSFGNHVAPHEMRWLGTVRGLECRPECLDVLNNSVARWRERLDAVAFPTLARWVRYATNAQQLGRACVVYAHLAYLYRNVLEAELDRRAVATLLTAQIFLNVHYAYDAEPTPPSAIGPDGKSIGERRASSRSKFVERANDELGFTQTEIQDLFARHRGAVIRWLDAHQLTDRS